MTITHHLWYMALFIFRTFEAFYQIFHTSLGGTAAYNILDITLYFWKVSGDFIYWVISDRNRISIFMIVSERTRSVIGPWLESICLISKENIWFFPCYSYFGHAMLSHFACYTYVCSVTVLVSMLCHQTWSMVCTHFTHNTH